jgi:hypothetical protein
VLSVVMRLSNQNIQPQRTQSSQRKKRAQLHTSFLGVLGALCGYAPF